MRVASWPQKGIAALALFVVGIGGAVFSPLAQGAEGGALHIVRRGAAEFDTLRKWAWALEHACRVGNKLPETAPTPLSDSTLARVPLLEIEEFFSGGQWARYQTTRSILPDHDNACRLTVYVYRSATVERTCERRISGRSRPLSDLTSGNAGASDIKFSERDLPSRRCDGTPPDVPVGLSRHDAGQGVTCIWTSSVLRGMLGSSDMAEGAQEGFDTCLLADMPGYAYRGSRRPVIVMTRGTGTPKDSDNAVHMHERVVANQTLKSLSRGAAVDAGKFTRAGIETFVRLPAKLPLETTP